MGRSVGGPKYRCSDLRFHVCVLLPVKGLEVSCCVVVLLCGSLFVCYNRCSWCGVCLLGALCYCVSVLVFNKRSPGSCGVVRGSPSRPSRAARHNIFIYFFLTTEPTEL